MPSYRVNALANFLGQLLAGLITIAVIPFYLGLMGPAGYGVVALLLSIQASLTLLDLGLSVATNRELAHAAVPGSNRRPADFFASIEPVYAVMGAGTGALLALGAPLAGLIADDVPAGAGPAFRWFGLLFALRWPVVFYVSVLRGLERQVAANLITCGHTAARTAGTLLVLALVAPTPLAFVLAQAGCSLIEVVHFRWTARRAIRQLQPEAGRFAWDHVRKVWRFSLTATATSLAATLVKQSDKFFLASFGGVHALGYYYAASEASRAIQLCATPLTNAAYPRFTALHAQAKLAELKAFFLRISHLTSFLVAGAVGALAGLAGNVLWQWSHDDAFVAEGALPFTLLVFGYGLNAMMQLPYSLQLATGHNRINMQFLFGYVPVGLPISYFVIRHSGATGAAAMWLVFNLAYVALVPPLMDRQVGFRFARSWLAETAKPFALALAGWWGLAASLSPSSSLLPAGLAAAAFVALYAGVAYHWFLDRSLLRHPRDWLRTVREGA
ncbi:MAG TPA: oligosaccharide flippase family protein [Opitutaceae bacterium]|nr:oligosaccharide flippase family protein [Opitutaceae bacterium]